MVSRGVTGTSAPGCGTGSTDFGRTFRDTLRKSVRTGGDSVERCSFGGKLSSTRNMVAGHGTSCGRGNGDMSMSGRVTRLTAGRVCCGTIVRQIDNGFSDLRGMLQKKG